MKLFRNVVILFSFTGAVILAASASPQNDSSSVKPSLKKLEGSTHTAKDVSFRPGSGTIIVAELTKALNAKKLATGDLVNARVTQDLLYQGKVIIPPNVKILGHVTGVKAANKEDPESRLGVVFDKIILNDGREMPFQRPAIIEALAPQMKLVRKANQNVTDLPVQMEKGQVSGNAMMHAAGPETRINGGTETVASGALSGSARGVIGIKGLSLTAPEPETSVITSSKGDVKLDYGTQMVLRVTGPTKE